MSTHSDTEPDWLRYSRRFLIGACLALLIGASLAAYAAVAQAPGKEPPMTMRAIMQELGAQYLRLANALLIDDFDGLEASAKAIQGHPLPDQVVAAIQQKLKGRFEVFERIDRQSHQAAAEVADRAAARDIIGSAKAFGSVAEACVTCHERFRTELRPLSD